MPRDGSNIYHYPPGTPGAPDTTIASAPYNSYIADVEQDLNIPRPIVAGGTGATNDTQARLNLQTERASQVITNFDTHTYEIGSFYAASTVTAPPGGFAHQFAGVVYGVVDPVTPANTRLVVEARDLDDTTVPGVVYVREKIGTGAWSAWLENQTGVFVKKIGDTMTGDLTINKDTPVINLKKTAGGQTAAIFGYSAVNARWGMHFGDGATETGANVGSDFRLNRYNDAGAAIDAPFVISRATGIMAFTVSPTAPTPAVADRTTKLATTAFVNQDQSVGTGVDFNTLTAPGTYSTAGANNNPNEPTGAGQWYVRVATYGGAPAFVVQMAHSLI